MGKVLSSEPYRLGLVTAFIVAMAFAVGSATVLAAGAPVNINTADLKTLEALPGVGPATAKEIVKGRPYKTVDDLARVKGITEGKLERLKPMVVVGGKAAPASPRAAQKARMEAKKAERAAGSGAAGPVNINTATQEELEALPGLGQKKAEAVIAGRPYAKPEDIMRVKGIKQGVYDKIKHRITVR